MVYTLAFKMVQNKEEAEEISQDAFIKGFKSLDKFKGESKFSTWIYKIAYRTCLDVLKKRKDKYRTDTIDEITINKIEATEGALDALEKKERATVIKECMQDLPEDERTVLWMFYFDELSLKEILEITDFSEANLKVKLHRARKRLLDIVKRKVEPELISHYGRK